MDDDRTHLEPVVLLVSVVVFCSAQRVRHSLDGVDDRTGEIVGGVSLVLRPRAVMGRVVES